MTKEELEKEAEDKGIKYADSLEYTISKFSDEEGYCWSQVEQAYEKGALDFAEPREKRIAELEDKLVNADYQLEGRDLEIKELKAQIEKMKNCANCSKFRLLCTTSHFTNGICSAWEIKEK